MHQPVGLELSLFGFMNDNTTSDNDFIFAALVDAVLAQPGSDIESKRFRELQPQLYKLAHRVKDTNTLVTGLYRLRHFLPEGGNLQAWIATYNIALTRDMSFIQRLQLQSAQAWHLLNICALSTTELVIDAIERQLPQMAGVSDIDTLIPARVVGLDLTTYRLLLQSLGCVGSAHIEIASANQTDAYRYGRPAQRHRATLALGAILFSAGLIRQAIPVLDMAFEYFAPRQMNTETGIAAFGLARAHCALDGIDPLTHRPEGRGERCLEHAAKHFSAIAHPLGLRLIAPYLEHVGFAIPEVSQVNLPMPQALVAAPSYSFS